MINSFTKEISMKNTYIRFLAMFTLLISPLVANAGIIYQVDLDIGAGNASGYIETDGTIGTLETANIVDWELVLTAPNLSGGSSDTINVANQSQMFIAGDVTASAIDIMFNFVGTAEWIFQGGDFSNFLCLDGLNRNCSGSGDSTASIGFDDNGNGFTEVESFTSNTVVATVAAMPVSTPATIALLGLGLAGLGWKRSHKK